ncbi:hypothetical protein Q8W40_24525 [Vibrio penaeicida]|uniref:phage adaptor protein n=1 Tax=Vibrio penaeicida TaxID=104609 RepID=UPI002733326E|nr:hypothetical protein [Vibrio penaeicida]MDP2575384.1 hypothetical protein [Vibrio penaeicida]
MIQDYSELIAEASHRSGVTNIAQRARMLVGMAEKNLSKRLRLANMETVAELTTDANGSASLPSDYQEMRSVRVCGREIKRLPLDVLFEGHQWGFAIQGKALKSSYQSKVHRLVYYAAIPSLEAENTSWLLDDEPELYLHALLFQIYTAINDIDKAQATASYLSQLIESANQADHMYRHAGTRIHLGGIVP